MARYQVAQLDEIEEVSDGRCPLRPVRHRFGITSFGVNSWTARAKGDRIINDHDEADEDRKRADLVPAVAPRSSSTASAWTRRPGRVFAEPGVKRTACVEEPTTIVALGGTPGKPTSRTAGRSARRSTRCTRRASTKR
jgi:hypothetical protein